MLTDRQRLEYLDAMGIQVWRSKAIHLREQAGLASNNRGSLVDCSDIDPLSPEAVSNENSVEADIEKKWSDLESEVAVCKSCELHCSRTQTVFGVGSHRASWMIIGEAPGANEDQQGEPFVGRAGRLLNEMLRALELERKQVFIANILKCRPPQNRDPQSEEVVACEHFLSQQVSLLKPKIILAVGRVAAQNLLKTDAPLSKLRGKVHYYGEFPVVVVYHPAYLLRSPFEKRKAWMDLQLAGSVMGNTGK